MCEHRQLEFGLLDQRLSISAKLHSRTQQPDNGSELIARQRRRGAPVSPQQVDETRFDAAEVLGSEHRLAQPRSQALRGTGKK